MPDFLSSTMGDRHAVFVNFSDDELTVTDIDGRVRVGTDRTRDGETVRGSLRLRGWEGAILEISAY